jgi:hypothetical protein
MAYFNKLPTQSYLTDRNHTFSGPEAWQSYYSTYLSYLKHIMQATYEFLYLILLCYSPENVQN